MAKKKVTPSKASPRKSSTKKSAPAAKPAKKASKSTPAKAKTAKKAAVKSKVAAPAVKKKPAPATKSSVKSTTKAVVKPQPKPTPKPAVKTSIRPLPAMRNWDLRDVIVTFSQSRYVTRFHYVRQNPEDCDVRIRYSSFHDGPLDNTITDPKDHGGAQTNGKPQEWNALEIIPTGYRVSVQLCQNFAPMTPAVEVIVQSVP